MADTGAEIVVEGGEARIVTSEGDVAWRKLPYRSFPTDPDNPEEILPDFFHLWPATLATAHDLAGRAGLFNLTPALALAAVALVWLATRRAFGVVAATVAGGLLAVNELQVWQAKFPTAESLSEVLYAGALLAVVLALATRWRVAAGLGGVLVGLGFVARPEGILVVALAATALAVLWALRGLRWGEPAVVFGLAVVPPLMLGAYQAYGRDSRYAELQEGLPSFAGLSAGFVLLVLGAVVLRLLVTRVPAVASRVRAVEPERAARLAGWALTGAFAAFLVLAWLRPQLLGETFRVNKEGVRSRGYDEINLHRLAIFVTPLALVAAVGALVVGVRERWSAARWALVVPGVLIAPVLIWEPHIAPDLMWWGRRFVPIVLPTLLVLVGAAAAWLWQRKALGRVVTVVLVLGMAGYTLRQSSDLWGHEEFGGSVEVVDQLDELVPEDGVVVWQGGTTHSANFAITPFTWLGLPGISGPPAPTAEGLLALQEALDGRPLYLVTEGEEPGPRLAGALEPVGRITGELSEFEHGFESRPRRARPIPVDLTVWRLNGP